ncbi:MAG: hypothetical protein R2853_11160 [Thermomicrobiales bacterium]
MAAHEIDEFKAEHRARYPGRDVFEISDEDLLREVMNTVGKPGKLGEQVRCVVSVSMLTEGWTPTPSPTCAGRARLRHPAPLRASGGARPAPHELRRQ